MRLSAMAILVVSLVGALTARLWYLTAVEGEASVQANAANSTRVIHIQAPRGRIFDRNRQMLVDNQQVRQVRIDQRVLDETVGYEDEGRREIYGRLAESLNRYEVPVLVADVRTAARLQAEADDATDAQTERAIAEAELTAADATWDADIVLGALTNNNEGPFVPTPVANDVPEDLEVLLAENHLMYPGVDVEPVAVRYYPHGTLAAHVLGYVKSISEEELASDSVQEMEETKPYALGDDIGKSGVELSYEQYLRGVPGERVIEVDADNNPVRTISFTPPVPGYDLMLELDVQVQALLELSIRDQAEANDAPGAAGVVMDPATGGIVAMASFPEYNPVELSGHVSPSRYLELAPEDGSGPLTNKAISGQYFPGSTFKPVTALAGLRAGVVTPEFSWSDSGTYTIEGCEGEGCTVQNAGEVALGTVNMASSLTQSSDTYYYRIGDQLWGARGRVGEDALQVTAEEFGFGERTAVDLPSASSGFIWTPEFLSEHCHDSPEACVEGEDQRWRTGDNVNLSIGQGYIGVTPLQLTNMYAALGNNGTLHTPHVGQAVLERHPDSNEWTTVLEVQPDALGHIDMRPQWRSSIMQGLLGVPQAGPGGTAATAFEDFDLAGYPIAGKTGTSQKEGEGDYGLFVGMGPVRNGIVGNDGYVVSAIFEAVAQFGGTVAAPPVRQVFDGLRDRAFLPAVPCLYQATPIAATRPSDCPTDGSVPDTGVVTAPVEDEG
jgi:penicillin-binding protein 2